MIFPLFLILRILTAKCHNPAGSRLLLILEDDGELNLGYVWYRDKSEENNPDIGLEFQCKSNLILILDVSPSGRNTIEQLN